MFYHMKREFLKKKKQTNDSHQIKYISLSAAHSSTFSSISILSYSSSSSVSSSLPSLLSYPSLALLTVPSTHGTILILYFTHPPFPRSLLLPHPSPAGMQGNCAPSFSFCCSPYPFTRTPRSSARAT